MGNRECLQCGADINHKRSDAQYCDKRCKNAATHTRRPQRDMSGYYEDNAARNRERHFKDSYGITRAKRDEMFADQDGNCACCGQRMTLESHKPNSACVDHCHTTGDVHRLLCAACNKGLGLLGENPVILAKAIQYLTETGKVPTR